MKILLLYFNRRYVHLVALASLALFALLFVKREIIAGSLVIRNNTLAMTRGRVESAQFYRNQSKQPSYLFDIHYSFIGPNGQTYRSNRINYTIAEGVRTPEEAQEHLRVNGYTPGSIVTVFYKKDEPTFSVLEPQRSVLTLRAAGAVLLVAILFAGNCLWFFLVGRNDNSL